MQTKEEGDYIYQGESSCSIACVVQRSNAECNAKSIDRSIYQLKEYIGAILRTYEAVAAYNKRVKEIFRCY